uniref:PDZ domain-containing protein n=1 Tax=Panagrolaimus sp. ES5 TaxID=591445 RepID=A0AC34FM81_9BILA
MSHKSGGNDRELKHEIEKIIAIFKSQLFRNLCAIYDFQDDILLNERISFDEKVRETKRFAERWENNPPFGATSYKSPLLDNTGLSSHTTTTHTLGGGGGGSLLDRTFDRPYTNGFDTHSSHAPTNQSSHSYTFQEQKRELTRDGWATQDYLTKTVDGPAGVQTQTTSSSNLIDSHGQEWDIVDVVIEKNQTGLGFSISGGRDRIETDNHHIHVTDISPGGAVARDGRIKVNDIILKVNNVDCVDVDHQIAVDALKSSGPVVRLLVKRPKPTRSVSQSNLTNYQYPQTNAGTTGFSSYSQTVTSAPPPLPVSHHHSPISSTTQQRIPIEIQRLELNPNVRKLELIKGPSGLGFSIAGGYGNQHVAGDNGIFVTRIIENSAAYYDGRIPVDNVIFDNVTHEFAVNTLKSTGNKVTIYYEKNPYPDYVPPPIDDSSRSITGIGMGNRSASSQQFPDQPPYGGSQSHLAYIQQPELQPRVVTLRKGDGGLGFNIVGGEDGEPVYVSHVLPGGVADLSGNVRKGDVLLQVNDVDLRNSTHNHAALALKNCPPNTFVNLTLHYQPDQYAHFEQKVEQLRNDMLAKQAGGVAAPGVITAQR